MTDPATQFTVPAAADAVAAVIGDRDFIIQGDRRYTYAQIVERSNRLAAYLHSRGLGCKTERSELAGHEVGQDLLGIYAYNGPEYVEAMLGSWRARVAPFNVNYRYVKDELQYLLADSGATALLYHAKFAPRVAKVLPKLPHLRVLIQIADDSGNDLVHGAVDYESIVASGASVPPPVEPSPDDLYVLYTGGTTGMPKGVLWRAHDIFMTSFGGRSLYTGEVIGSLDDIAKGAAESPGTKLMILPPLMHGAAQWATFTAMNTGQSVVFSSVTSRLDPDDVVATIEREKVLAVTVVGDAMARPLADAIERTSCDLSSLAVVANGGALLTPTAKQRLIDIKPGLIVVDGVGSSETGAQMSHMSAPGAVSTGTFNAGPDTSVASEDLGSILEPGHDGMGWLAQRGYVPLGYKGDAAKTAATFPVIDGVRYSVPGDRARHLADGANRAARPRLGDHQLRRREDLRRGGRVGGRVAPGGGRRGGRGPAQRAVGAGGRRDRRACRGGHGRRAGTHRPRRRRHRPLQAAEGRGVPAGHRTQPGGQGRLPVGPRAGAQRRRMSRRRHPQCETRADSAVGKAAANISYPIL